MNNIIYRLQKYIRYIVTALSEKYSLTVALLLLGIALFAGLLMVFCLVGYWKIFEKAGYRGWLVFVPFYNLFLLSRIAGKSGVSALLWLVPGVNVVYYLLICLALSRSFSVSRAFAFGLWLLPCVFSLLLGFGSAECSTARAAQEEEVYWTRM